MKRCPRLMGYNPCDILSPNINTLLDNGVAKCNIASAICSMPITFVTSPNKFKVKVEEAKEMGFDPSKRMFMVALYAMSMISKPTFKSKVEAFKNFGWTEEDVSGALHRCPKFMLVSEDKSMVMMDFLVNKMGFPSSVIVKRPQVLRGA
ncbi:Mitochondrial transcription termination factor family protein, putative isoform 2 [Hibiscus syriacus]|uniref:Mitochondrial transcription termination factor family protein, putative isoform 2 n=2 Tax=Hibiscus syriacus TaxID=106335 RepID=A0A6A2Y5N1_HIBSY|nr:Mitochondrial transcription termination factor family protein, putative isoform 2 [Hibiscus syriacus]